MPLSQLTSCAALYDKSRARSKLCFTAPSLSAQTEQAEKAARTKALLQEPLIWLTYEFGLEASIGGPMILPTHEFFPECRHNRDHRHKAAVRVDCGIHRGV